MLSMCLSQGGKWIFINSSPRKGTISALHKAQILKGISVHNSHKYLYVMVELGSKTKPRALGGVWYHHEINPGFSSPPTHVIVLSPRVCCLGRASCAVHARRGGISKWVLNWAGRTFVGSATELRLGENIGVEEWKPSVGNSGCFEPKKHLVLGSAPSPLFLEVFLFCFFRLFNCFCFTFCLDLSNDGYDLEVKRQKDPVSNDKTQSLGIEKKGFIWDF